MLLGNLLSGKEASNLVILEDTVEVSARPLLCCFIKSLLKRVDLVCIVVFELPSDKFRSAFDAEASSRILCIDGFSDPLLWNTPKRESCNAFLHHHKDIVNTVRTSVKRKCLGHQTGDPLKVSVIIDSLSHLVLGSASLSCQILHQLSRTDDETYQMEQIVGLIHSDLHDEHVINALNSISSSVVQLIPYNQALQTEEFDTYCKILHLRKTGKVLKKKQLYSISEEYELTESQEEEWTAKPAVNIPLVDGTPEKRVDPTSNLSFNLKLTREEQQARANIQLPYMFHTKMPSVQPANKISGESKIFYQPDEVDDFDEDDPDDDLDV